MGKILFDTGGIFMVIKRYIEASPVEYSELTSKSVSSDKIQMAIDAAQKRALVQNDVKQEKAKQNERA